MPDDLKETTERCVSDDFVRWRNARRGTTFTFSRHGSPPSADVEYTDGSGTLDIEVTGAHYDQDGARFENMNARDLPDAPEGWSSIKDDGTIVAIDVALVDFLNDRLAAKAVKIYSRPPLLVLHHISRFHHSAGLKVLFDRVVVPTTHPFVGIYILARLPDGDPEGRVWVYPLVEEP